MDKLLNISADAQGHRQEAKRARELAKVAAGKLQDELLEIAALYDRLADGRNGSELADCTVSAMTGKANAQAFARFRRPWPPDIATVPTSKNRVCRARETGEGYQTDLGQA